MKRWPRGTPQTLTASHNHMGIGFASGGALGSNFLRVQQEHDRLSGHLTKTRCERIPKRVTFCSTATNKLQNTTPERRIYEENEEQFYGRETTTGCQALKRIIGEPVSDVGRQLGVEVPCNSRVWWRALVVAKIFESVWVWGFQSTKASGIQRLHEKQSLHHHLNVIK